MVVSSFSSIFYLSFVFSFRFSSLFSFVFLRLFLFLFFLFLTLLEDTKPPKDQLWDTGLGEEKEMLLSSVFVTTPYAYGTRCTSAILVNNDKHVQCQEKTYPLLLLFFIINTPISSLLFVLFIFSFICF